MKKKMFLVVGMNQEDYDSPNATLIPAEDEDDALYRYVVEYAGMRLDDHWEFVEEVCNDVKMCEIKSMKHDGMSLDLQPEGEFRWRKSDYIEYIVDNSDRSESELEGLSVEALKEIYDDL